MNALLCFSDKIIIKKFLYLIKIKKNTFDETFDDISTYKSNIQN